MILNGCPVKCAPMTVRPVNDKFILSAAQHEFALTLNVTSYEIYKFLLNATEEHVTNKMIVAFLAERFEIAEEGYDEVEKDVADTLDIFFKGKILVQI